jgi:probable DNA repair protein
MLILTANKRLAQTYLSQYAQQQLAAGLMVWEAPDVLPFAVWQRQLWDAWVVAQCEAGIAPPVLLDSVQTKVLWQQVIEANAASLSALLHPVLLAAQAAQAWKLLHAWQIDAQDDAFAQGSLEHTQFLQWMQAFDWRCQQENWLDEARLLSQLMLAVTAKALPLPTHIRLLGFVQMTGAELHFWQSLQSLGITVDGLEDVVVSMPSVQAALSFASIDDEQQAIADWVNTQLSVNQDARLVIAVPQMAAWRDALLEKILLSCASQSLLPNQLDAPPPVNLSLGDALVQQPVVAVARLGLGLMPDVIDHADLLILLRSPFTGGTDDDLRLAQWLTEAQTLQWRWNSLYGRLQHRAESLQALAVQDVLSDKDQRQLSMLQQGLLRLDRWRPAQARHDVRLPSQWAQWMRARVQGLGIRAQGLGSLAYQAWSALDDTFDLLAPLDLVSGAVSLSKALSLLDGLLVTPWQPRQGKTQVQLLGMMEAAGLACDALWVADMGFEQWPPKATPNPLIPLRLQKQAGVRDADPSKQADYARHLLAAVMENAQQITVSHARSDGSRVDLLPTGLLDVVWQSPHPSLLPRGEGTVDLLPRPLGEGWGEGRWQDWQAPALAVDELARGGTGLFKHQSLCPFRAFAQLRLDAKESKTASEGPDAALRGTLVHNSLEAVWKAIGDSATLLSLTDTTRQTLVCEQVAATLKAEQEDAPDLLGERYMQLEQQRITDLIVCVLKKDTDDAKVLPPFVVESEASLRRSVCGVDVNLRIDRLQVFDTPSGKATWIVDYKTGTVSAGDWDGDRPWEPQLPVYALALQQKHDIAAVAFYALKDAEHPQLLGASRDDVPLPKRNSKDEPLTPTQWQAKLVHWQTTLQRLSDDFRAGVAIADPLARGGKSACDYCHLALLCRKHEWIGGEG